MKLSNLLLEANKRGYELFCDLDGVLCDFEKAFKAASGENLSFDQYANHYSLDQAWAIVDKEGVKFWAKMPWTPDGSQLWNAIKKYKPTILSAPSKHWSSTFGKKIWVKKNLGEVPAIYVPAKYKQKYAANNHILIDDYSRNIKQWIEKGGIGILHKNTNDTLSQLAQYL